MTTLSKAKIVEWEEQDGIRKEAQEWVAKANTANVERMRQDTATGITDIVSPVEVDPIWEALAVSRYYAHALRNEAGPPGSWTEEQVIEGERERFAYVRAKKHTGTRPVNAEDTTGARDRAKDTNICIFKNKYRIRERLQPIRPAKYLMPMHVRLRTQGKRWWYCRKHTGVPRSSRSLPKHAERS